VRTIHYRLHYSQDNAVTPGIYPCTYDVALTQRSSLPNSGTQDVVITQRAPCVYPCTFINTPGIYGLFVPQAPSQFNMGCVVQRRACPQGINQLTGHAEARTGTLLISAVAEPGICSIPSPFPRPPPFLLPRYCTLSLLPLLPGPLPPPDLSGDVGAGQGGCCYGSACGHHGHSAVHGSPSAVCLELWLYLLPDLLLLHLHMYFT
jgi:hypothetical protein